jgi:hypothetical protein
VPLGSWHLPLPMSLDAAEDRKNALSLKSGGFDRDCVG